MLGRVREIGIAGGALGAGVGSGGEELVKQDGKYRHRQDLKQQKLERVLKHFTFGSVLIAMATAQVGAYDS